MTLVTENENLPLVVAITGASGAAYGIWALELLAAMPEVETHLMLTAPARTTIGIEADRTVAEVEALADVVHPIRDIAAGPASGSFRSMGMLVAPCSIWALSAIANSHSADLLTRAADVTLKERRPLVLMVRETPLHLGHLRLMERVVELGGVVFPPVPAFYTNPSSLDEVVSHSASRALEQLGLEVEGMARWVGSGSPSDSS
jgi:4-hydroxy-3-polyprenylbenzoate decarboxylase